MTKIIAGHEWIMHVLQNMGIDSSKVRRVVIDAACDAPIVMYIERYGDERLLSVRAPESGEVVVSVSGEAA